VLIARFQPGGILTLIKRLSERRGKTAEPSAASGAPHAP
jgi:branched-chain amino acid transport system permease protein